MISIILPSYHEESNVRYIYKSILLALDNRPDLELIYVDDGSKDNTFTEIRELALADKRVRGIRLSRNFGQQCACLAGLQEARGDMVIMMDSDGQHPPSVLPGLINKMGEGYDVVNTRRIDCKNGSWFRKMGSRVFCRMIKWVSDIEISNSLVDFRIINRKALDAFLEFKEQNRFNRGLFTWIGFRQTQVEFKAEQRNGGQSRYTLKKLIHLALDGLTSFSSRPLRISFYLGLITMLIGLAYGVLSLARHLAGNAIPDHPSLLVAVLIIGGVQLLSVGIIGEYIGRILSETKGRPKYFVSERV